MSSGAIEGTIQCAWQPGMTRSQLSQSTSWPSFCSARAMTPAWK